jgi:hypothetical protein
MSSAADMSRYLTMYLNWGVLDGRRIVSRQALETMLTPVGAGELGPWADQQETRYGMGWFVGGPWQQPALLHPGRDPDSSAMIVLLPRQRLAVVTLANANNELPLPGGASAMQRIPRGVVSLLLGEQPEVGTTLTRLYIAFDVAVGLVLMAIAWALTRLPRRRHRALTLPRRALGVVRGTGEVALGALLLAAPVLSGQGYAGALLWTPDLAVVVLVTGGLLVPMGATRIVLRLRAPSPAGTEVPVGDRAAAAPAPAGSTTPNLPHRPRPLRRPGRDRRRAERSPTPTRDRQ